MPPTKLRFSCTRNPNQPKTSASRHDWSVACGGDLQNNGNASFIFGLSHDDVGGSAGKSGFGILACRDGGSGRSSVLAGPGFLCLPTRLVTSCRSDPILTPLNAPWRSTGDSEVARAFYR
jgi:hypothetical protein